MIFWLALAFAAPQPMALDAGPFRGQVLHGMSRLHQEGCDDPRARWITPPQRAIAGTWPDPVLGDGLVGGVLHLDLAEGQWRIAVMLAPQIAHMGQHIVDDVGLRIQGVPLAMQHRPEAASDWLNSPWHTSNPRPIFRPGETIFQRQLADESEWREVTITVPPGGIDLEAIGWPLRALIARPADDPAWEATKLMIDGRRFRFFSTHYVPILPDPPQAIAGPLTAEWVRIDEATGPAISDPTLHLAKADRTSIALRILGGDHAGRIEVEAPHDLHVEVAEASWLDADAHRERPIKARPTVLWQGDRWQGGQGVPPTLALTIQSTAATPAGHHAISIRLIRGDSHTDISLPVVVHPVTIDKNTFYAGLYADPDMTVLRHEGREAPITKRLVQDLLTLLAHEGLDAISMRALFVPEPLPLKVADVHRLTQLVKQYVDIWHQHGGRVFEWIDMWQYSRLAAYEGQGIVQDPVRLKGLNAVLDGAWAIKPWFHAWEEEGWRHPNVQPGGYALAKAWHALPNAPVLAATMPMPQDLLVADAFDVIFVSERGSALCDAVHYVQSIDRQAWTYNLAPGRIASWRTWACGADGILQWHADDSIHDPFDHTNPGQRWQMTLLGPDARHHGTMLLKAFADGAADARLFSTAQAWAQHHKGRRAKAVQSVLSTLRDALMTAHIAPDGMILPPEQMALVREQLLTAWAPQ